MLSRGCLVAFCASAAFAGAACNALLDNGEATYVGADAALDVATFEDAAGGSDSGIFAGKNGSTCIYSAYNCQLRADAGEDIVRTAGRDDDWGIDSGAVIRDGNGDVLALVAVPDAGGVPRVPFQYGQRRELPDAGMHALAAKTSNDSPGWIALSDILGLNSFKDRMGPIVIAQSEGLARMACYRILDRTEPDLEGAKFVYDAADKDPSGADYLPAVRANGKRSASLAFNVPGSMMRGTIIDHFPSGTRFQRLNIASTFGGQHVDAPLWIKDAEGRYRTLHDRQALPFVYGYVLTSAGERRTGWMAYAALGPVNNQPCD
ncbi:hypothetical protein LZC95_18060 [Pendulispora brunnea]|uniref:Phytase-like domain-containing protein n=1 Tax=Pendulispora brunnea TaxID=2905690 RepID=A0ABZ2KN12_9BACT